MKWPNHGGQPEKIKQLLNINMERKLLDFSANLNPLGPPSWLKATLDDNYEKITRYPDPSYSNSILTIANHEGVEQDNVLLTNGGAEAIFLVAKYFENKKTMIVHPTFSEYERACKHYHIDVEDIFYEQENDFNLQITLISEKLKEKDVLFLCRPNNPTGTVVAEEDLQLLLEEGKKTETFIVVDEAFVDFLLPPTTNLSTWLASYPNLILLRSLTKLYTIPGLRIGYILARPSIINVLKNEQIPWSVNSLVDAVVPKLLEDRAFIEDTRAWLYEQSKSVYEMLAELDFYTTPSQVNFYLLRDKKHPNRTEELFYFLLEHGILTRHTHNFKGLKGEFLRIAIRSKEENEQLLDVLRKWRNGL
ncbi:L-threonine O-3-phosphate decarboxylase [Ureibacillus acetophenoni]|uniref:threonine-phosphate decarboxylase n=2 Tax=Ureibacillus acetophenoni TaxID=614649 RepID=A0A285UMZ4_9BACL|nr:L-threonine O-3-phosphate decarboxylase [Ureibacillus acetophenoni]